MPNRDVRFSVSAHDEGALAAFERAARSAAISAEKIRCAAERVRRVGRSNDDKVGDA